MNTSILLKAHSEADVIFAQEIYWGHIKSVASTKDKEGDSYQNTVSHPSFIVLGASVSSRVAVYVNKRWKDAQICVLSHIIQHDDILAVSISPNEGHPLTFLNVYNDCVTNSAVKYLADKVERLGPVITMAGDFNLHHEHWNAGKCRPDANRRDREISELLIETAHDLDMLLINDPMGKPTWRSNNTSLAPQVLDLVWVNNSLSEHSALWIDMAGRQSDHAILKWGINTKVEPPEPSVRIKPDSIQMAQYLNDLHDGLKEINNLYRDVNTRGTLKAMCEDVESMFWETWEQHASIPDIRTKSKTWWVKENTTAAKSLKETRTQLATMQAELKEVKEILRKYDSGIPDPALDAHGGRDFLADTIPEYRNEIKALRRQEKSALYELRKSVRASKKKHFNKIIVETPHNTAHFIWKLVPWTQPRKQSAFSALKDAYGNIASTAEDRARVFKDAYHPPPKPTDPECLADMKESPTRGWKPLTVFEVKEALAKTNNESAPGPDRITWGVIKNLFRIDGFPFHDKGELRPNLNEPEDLPPDQHTLAIITRMFNLCIKFGVWPEMFKRAITVVIPKPGKDDYTKAKAFRPIVLLNCLGKLCEKVLANRMQFDAQKFGLVHPCQYGGTMAHSTTDAGINL
ncbi:hypothetical protein PHLCEN_2v3601, partial [Hermanssonia centrifuga]